MFKLTQPTEYKDGKSVPRDLSHLNFVGNEVIRWRNYEQVYSSFGQGLTLEYKSHYLGDGDSVGSVAVWDPIEKKPVWFGLGYENMESNPNQIIIYDATPEVKAEYQAYKDEEERKRKAAEKAHKAYLENLRKENEKNIPRKGKTVKVVKGRKIPIGTFGKVFWYGQTQFGWSVGLIVEGVRMFTSASNVEVLPGNLEYLQQKYEEKCK